MATSVDKNVTTKQTKSLNPNKPQKQPRRRGSRRKRQRVEVARKNMVHVEVVANQIKC
jgi:hypothetical protein